MWDKVLELGDVTDLGDALMVLPESCEIQEGAETKLYMVAIAVFNIWEAIFFANVCRHPCPRVGYRVVAWLCVFLNPCEGCPLYKLTIVLVAESKVSSKLL